jgi:hypothetical protein
MTDEAALTPDEKLWAFRKASNSMEGAPRRWTERVETGLTDEQLSHALEYELGQMGGHWGYEVSVEHEARGLKIWASHGMRNRHKAVPMCAGPATLRLAREVYGIADPDEKQGSLF